MKINTEAQNKSEAVPDEAGLGGLKPTTSTFLTTMVILKGTSFQHLKLFGTQFDHHCPRQQYDV